MPIYVHQSDTQREYQPGDFVLYHTDWNDWWTYENLYTLKYIRTNSTTVIGQVKIGQLDDSELRIPELPERFDQLDPTRFISLGQDPSYYDALNHLALSIKEQLLKGLTTVFSGVNVNRYICCCCGYTEEWIGREDLEKVKGSKKAKAV